ncbi:MAG: hypothetical protein AB7R77_12655 [Ilumatobacteraceae bacterium]
MTITTPPAYIQAGSHPASTLRKMTQGLLQTPFGSFSGGAGSTAGWGGHGIVGPSDFAVTQNGTPNMSVNVLAGACFVRGTQSNHQGVYHGYNDASVNVTISPADGTNPRRDLIVVQIRDAEYSGASNDARIVAVTGTPAASPADPTIPANSLVLARVAVAAEATSITNANITDLRVRAAALGGTIVCTSSTRPGSPAEGMLIYETDTDKVRCFNGSAWFTVAQSSFKGGWQTHSPLWTNLTIGDGTQDHTYYQDGSLVHARGNITFGASTSIGGSVLLGLPVTPKSAVWFVGTARAQDSSDGFKRYIGSAEINTSVWGSTIAFHFHGSANMTSTIPFGTAWANTDSLSYAVTYEAATPA